MVSGFLTKKIKSHQTLGEFLHSARKKLDVSIVEVEEKTKIRAKYLVALEKDDWNILPQDVYVRAFVLSYAKYLGVPVADIEKLLETEFAIHHREPKNQELIYKNSLKNIKVIVTPRLLAYFALSVFVLSLFGYITLQLASFAGSPALKIITPENNIVLEADSVDIRGITDNGTMLSVNNENIPVTNDGSFSLNLKLHQGVNIVKVKAMNKTKKESSQILTIEYKPKTAQAADSLINQQ